MLQVILACYVEFEERVGLIGKNDTRSSAYDIVKTYVQQKLGKFTGSDVVEHCPIIGRSSVLASLKKLSEEGFIKKQGSGKRTYYILSKND